MLRVNSKQAAVRKISGEPVVTALNLLRYVRGAVQTLLYEGEAC